MSRLIRPFRLFLTAIAAVFCLASLHAIATQPFSAWTMVVIGLCLIAVVGGVVLVVRRPDGAFLEPLVILLPGLVVGRLASTAWLVPAGQAVPNVGRMTLGETGPGLFRFEPLTLVLVAAVLLYVLAQAHRSISTRPTSPGLGATDWLAAILRAYVGLMFISHFTGHVLAGPIPFKAFVSLFGEIGMPFPAASVVLAGLIEIVVCVGLAFGVLTRPIAVLGVVYLLIATWIGGHFGVGYSWGLQGDGWEFPALWTSSIALFAIFGAGPISVDQTLSGKSRKRS